MNNIGLYVKRKRQMGDFVVLDVGRVSSTMTPLQTVELERLIHTLHHTSFGQKIRPSDKRGFPYTLPITLGR